MRGYTEEQLKWLEKNCKKHGSYRDMTDIFNFTFGESKKWKNLHGRRKERNPDRCKPIRTFFPADRSPREKWLLSGFDLRNFPFSL